MKTYHRRPNFQNVTARQHLMITDHKKMEMKTITKDEATSHDDEVVPSDVAPIGDMATYMQQSFTETDFLDEK